MSLAYLSPETVEFIEKILDIPLSDQQIMQFGTYRSLLMAWNEKMNLTAVRTSEGIETVHFIDSLTVLSVTGSLENQSIIDVGTGAGFPGIPLKIIFPSMRLSLVESVRKKASFLRAVVDELALEDVLVLDERAEDLGRDEAHREQYDWVMARAVAELSVLLEYLAPFCQVNGRLLAMKGPEMVNELNAAQKAISELQLNLLLNEKLSNQITGDKARFLVVFEKIGWLSERYPRRPGIPTKRPLR